VVRGESIGQVLASAGYNSSDLLESFRRMSEGAESKSKISPEERESFEESYRSALDSYTYLED